MLRKIINQIKCRGIPPDIKREEIMKAVREVTKRGCCVILATTPEGTRVIVLGKDTLTRQLEEISERKGIEL